MAAGYGPGKILLPKAMHKICGQPIVEYVVRSVLDVVNSCPLVVLAEGAEDIKNNWAIR